jgi:diguanylate cyclase (GGDEF)-like protein
MYQEKLMLISEKKQHITLTQRIVIGVSLMLFFGTLVSSVFFYDLIQLKKTVDQIVSIEEPISASGFEMEINALGTGLSVLLYLDTPSQALRKRAMEDMAEFEQFFANYDTLVEDGKAEQLGRELHLKFAEFRATGMSMMSLRDSQMEAFSGISALVVKMGALIEGNLLQRANKSTARDYGRMLLLSELDSELAESIVSLEHYMRFHEMAYKGQMTNNIHRFMSVLAQLKRLGVSRKDEPVVKDIDLSFEQLRKLIARKIEIHDDLRRHEAEFMRLREEIDNLLDEGVQSIAAQRHKAATQVAEATLDHSIRYGAVAAFLVVLLSFVGAVWLIRTIKGSLRELCAAADSIGSGNLTHRVPEQGNDELTELARHFNKMVSKLEETTVSKDRLQQSESSLRNANIMLFKEIEENRKAQDIIVQMAYYDPLTSLPNRRLFYDRLQHAVEIAQRNGQTLAVMLIDLDHFKEVNDSLGHDQGDLLLKQMGERVKATLRESDSVARLGGDEYAVLMPGASKMNALMVADKITQNALQPFLLNQTPFEIGISVGIALFPEHGQDKESLIRCADIAMYNAKKNSGGYKLYGLELHYDNNERLALLSDLRCAIEHQELKLHYQPLVSAMNGIPNGVEALLRWQHPTRGLLMAHQFIPLAESSNVLVQLTWWVIEEAVSQAAQWRENGLDIPVTVNVSPSCLQKQLAGGIDTILTRYALPPHYLGVEITEGTLMSNPVHVMGILKSLTDMGIRLVIDNFGKACSSLPYLSRLAISGIKIDKSFVLGMLQNEVDDMVVRTAINFAHSLCVSVTAEGVESADVLAKLAGYQCDFAQGYHVSHPVPAKELAQWFGRLGYEGLKIDKMIAFDKDWNGDGA